MELIDGHKVAGEIKKELSLRIQKLKTKGVTPHLSIIRVGEDSNSITYMKYKSRMAKEIGIEYSEQVLPETISEKDLLHEIEKLNDNPKISGIIVQFPVPKHISMLKVIETISPNKDVDGLNTINTKKLINKQSGIRSCTPLGIMKLIKRYKINVKNLNAVVLGRSIIVGNPMRIMLENAGANVSVCHRKTPDISIFTKKADLIVSATGSPNLITGDIVKDGVIVFDVGITKNGKKIIGDVDFKSVSSKAKFITPNPGGVGPMTIVMLLNNVVELLEKEE